MKRCWLLLIFVFFGDAKKIQFECLKNKSIPDAICFISDTNEAFLKNVKNMPQPQMEFQLTEPEPFLQIYMEMMQNFTTSATQGVEDAWKNITSSWSEFKKLLSNFNQIPIEYYYGAVIVVIIFVILFYFVKKIKALIGQVSIFKKKVKITETKCDNNNEQENVIVNKRHQSRRNFVANSDKNSTKNGGVKRQPRSVSAFQPPIVKVQDEPPLPPPRRVKKKVVDLSEYFPKDENVEKQERPRSGCFINYRHQGFSEMVQSRSSSTSRFGRVFAEQNIRTGQVGNRIRGFEN